MKSTNYYNGEYRLAMSPHPNINLCDWIANQPNLNWLEARITSAANRETGLTTSQIHGMLKVYKDMLTASETDQQIPAQDREMNIWDFANQS